MNDLPRNHDPRSYNRAYDDTTADIAVFWKQGGEIVGEGYNIG